MQKSLRRKTDALLWQILPTTKNGDVDLDGNVAIGDVRVVLRSICQKIELNEMQELAADVEKDDKVDIKDLRKILRYVCGKIDSL